MWQTEYKPQAEEDSIIQEDQDEEEDLITHIFKKRKVEQQDEFEVYLKDPVATYQSDILQWWKVNISLFIYLVF